MSGDPRATHWRILDAEQPDGPAQVHVPQVIYLNGEKARIHLHPTDPIVVRTEGAATSSVTLLCLTVHEDDVTFDVRAGMSAPDTLGGVPIRTPAAHAEHSWCEVRSVEPLPVRPNGSHFPRGDGNGAPMMSTHWVRLHVMPTSVEFGYRAGE